MGKKNEGKEGKILTMPIVFFKNFKTLKTLRVRQSFSEAVVETKQREASRCLVCGGPELIHYDSYYRNIKHVADNGAIYHLRVRCKRFKCTHCGKVFRERQIGRAHV